MKILYTNLTDTGFYMDILTYIFIEQGYDVSNRRTEIILKSKIAENDIKCLKTIYFKVSSKYNLKLPRLFNMKDLSEDRTNIYYLDMFMLRNIFMNKNRYWTTNELIELSSICKYIPKVFLTGLEMPDGSKVSNLSSIEHTAKSVGPLGSMSEAESIWILSNLNMVNMNIGKEYMSSDKILPGKYIGLTARLILPMSLICKIYEAGYIDLVISKKLHLINNNEVSHNHSLDALTQNTQKLLATSESRAVYKLTHNETFCSQNVNYRVLMHGTMSQWDNLLNDMLDVDARYEHSVLSSLFYFTKNYPNIQEQFINLDKSKAVNNIMK